VIYQAIVIAIVIAIGAGGAVRLYYAPRLALAQERIENLGSDIRMQNRAVSALHEAGELRAKEAAKAVAAARAQAGKHEQRAAELLAMQPESDGCEAIDVLLNEGLR